MERVFMRISAAFLDFITETAAENNLSRAAWLRECLHNAVTRPLPRTLMTDDVMLAILETDHRLDFKIPPDLLDKVDTKATQLGMTRSSFITLAVLSYLAQSTP